MKFDIKCQSSLVSRAIGLGVPARGDKRGEPIPCQLVDPVAVGQRRGLALLRADPGDALGEPS